MSASAQYRPIRPYTGDGTWTDSEIRPYKNDGNIFKDVTRQNLFDSPDLECQWRYFEVGPGGHSTLERHEHVHAVMIIRGRGQVLIDSQVSPCELYDLIYIPALTWHQFRAEADESLGFLCLVNQVRDRPQLPTTRDLEGLRRDPAVADFIRV